jgi:hypothetical protein
MALFGGSAFFIGLKWRAVMQRSEASKAASSKDINYSVAPGRSGASPILFHFSFFLPGICSAVSRWYG